MNSKQGYLLLLLLISFQNMEAQVQKLYQLSQNKYLGMKVILNENKDDVWGYSVFLEVSHVFAGRGKQVEITHLFVQLVSGNTKNAGSQRLVVLRAG